jgi:hypothetical protein
MGATVESSGVVMPVAAQDIVVNAGNLQDSAMHDASGRAGGGDLEASGGAIGVLSVTSSIPSHHISNSTFMLTHVALCESLSDNHHISASDPAKIYEVNIMILLSSSVIL